MSSMYGLGWMLDFAFEEEEELRDDEGVFIAFPRLCTHCHCKIKGKTYMIGENFYCGNCYRFRYILWDNYEKEKRKEELKKLLHKQVEGKE